MPPITASFISSTLPPAFATLCICADKTGGAACVLDGDEVGDGDDEEVMRQKGFCEGDSGGQF